MYFYFIFSVEDVMNEIREVGEEYSRIGWGDHHSAYARCTEDECLIEINNMPPRYKEPVPGVSYHFILYT